jgi:hypothetical protein
MHLAAVVERHGSKSQEVYPWIQVNKSADELFANPDIDLIVITTPNGSHYPLALQAMKSGKHGNLSALYNQVVLSNLNIQSLLKSLSPSSPRKPKNLLLWPKKLVASVAYIKTVVGMVTF